MRIGIDVGGTNTDSVLINNNKIESSFKTNTSEDISNSVKLSISEVIQNQPKEKINSIIIGTTHLINDLLERKNLSKTGVIRLCGPATRLLKPLCDWPDDIKKSNNFITDFTDGGLEFDGREISAVNKSEIQKLCEIYKKEQVESIAITGVFASVNPYQELEVKNIILNEMGKIPVSMSHQIGRIGLLERENATILNAMLSKSAKKTFANLTKIITELNLKSKIYITQNDGTMASINDALNYPIFSLSSGPTNSMRGAAFLSGIKDGIVIDIGGTSTDIGMLINSFPKESSIAVEFSGIRTNFRMADVLSIPLGGGSIINQKTPYVSNQSLGNRITTNSLSFNGSTTTITDIFTNQNKANFIPPNKNFKLSSNLIKSVENEIYSKISIAVDRMKTDSKNIKAIVVGGGSFIIPKKLDGVDLIKFPKFGEVANAIGSSMAQISGYSEKVFSTTDLSRDEIIEISKNEAIENAVKKGAEKKSIEIIDFEEIPLSYLPSNAVTIKTRAVGNIKNEFN